VADTHCGEWSKLSARASGDAARITAAEPTTMIAAFFSTVSPEGWSSFRLALGGAVPARKKHIGLVA
jgi:hypothetical protein